MGVSCALSPCFSSPIVHFSMGKGCVECDLWEKVTYHTHTASPWHVNMSFKKRVDRLGMCECVGSGVGVGGGTQQG